MSTLDKLNQWIGQARPEFEKVMLEQRRIEKSQERRNDQSESTETSLDVEKIVRQLLQQLEELKIEETQRLEDCLDRYWLIKLVLYSSLCVCSKNTEENKELLAKSFDILVSQLHLELSVKRFDEEEEPMSTKFANDDLAHLLIRLYFQAGSCKFVEEDYKSSIVHLQEADRLYNLWDKERRVFIHDTDLFSLDGNLMSIESMAEHLKSNSNEEERKKLDQDLERIYTLCTCFLAQAHQHSKNHLESARYCHLTLKKQYRHLDDPDWSIDRIEWALNAATLAQFFASNDQYNAARHMICCAKVTLAQAEQTSKAMEKLDEWNKADADLDRIVVKYCIMILEDSYQMIQKGNVYQNSSELIPYLLDDPKVYELERNMPSFPARNYDEAKNVFKHALLAIDRAKRFFSLQERATDHIECIFDQSAIYEALLPFESNVDNKCKMVKRQIDLLEALVVQLNPQYYKAYCRKLYHGLGELYLDQVYHKSKRYESLVLGHNNGNLMSAPPEVLRSVQQAARKVNLLVFKTVETFYKFLTSFEQLNKDRPSFASLSSLLELPVFPLPARFSSQHDSHVRAILMAYFNIARVITKHIAVNETENRVLIAKVDALLSQLLDYRQRNLADHGKLFDGEYLEQALQLRTVIRSH